MKYCIKPTGKDIKDDLNFSKGFTRRRVLRNTLKSAAAIPFLSHLPSFGASEEAKKKFIMMFSPNGTMQSEFWPEGSETEFTFKRVLEPLTPIKDDVILYQGMHNQVEKPGDTHQRGMGGLWTAKKLTEGGSKGGNPGDTPVAWAGGASIDQVIANLIGTQTRFKSLEYGVASGSANIWTRMCYLDRDVPMEPEMDPYVAFSRLYGSASSDGVSEQTQRSIRLNSVLDDVSDDLSSIRNFLSAEDRQKLEYHTQYVRQIEQTLQAPDISGDCYMPTLGVRVEINKDENIPKIGKLFMDLIVSALACGQTQVASLQWTRAVSQAQYTFLDVYKSHHVLSHYSDGVEWAFEAITKINNWYAQQFAYLVKKLKETPDPSGQGSLLDNSFMIWGNELGKGDSHSLRDIPFVSAGSLQGAFNTGRYIRQESQQPHAKLLTSIANAYGANLTGFGDFEEGELSNL
ncbi:MAG: DUF1552 domain-containing protein [Saccharospirillaceae bacterium]|nr:DUF1552 domain-containing protein [Pseudomonadales bacterium]NRB77790.1 DUF1552 domain-containing protein [Saccharospirillaceae bacterium]